MKNTLILAASAALVLSSCSKVEPVNEIVTPNDPDRISFTSNTTRANANFLSNVEVGFPVFGYANNASSASAWYNDGTTPTTLDGSSYYYKPSAINPSFSDYSGWQWRNAASTALEAPLWPEPAETAKWPMNFVAIYPSPSSVTAAITTGTNASASVKVTHSINTDRYNQQDLLAAKAQTSVKPNGGLALKFNHILSKINVSATTADGQTCVVNSVVLKNVRRNGGSYEYAAATPAWTLAAESVNQYAYRESVFTNSAQAQAAATSWKKPLAPAQSLALNQTNTDLNVKGDLMLTPHVNAVVSLPTNSDQIVPFIEDADNKVSYFEILYRVSSSTEDIIGVADITAPTKEIYDAAGTPVTATPGDIYASYDAATNASQYNTDGKIVVGDDLYVRAYFPINTSTLPLEWKQGYGYTYNLLLSNGGSGGFYADDFYYDEAGNQTQFKHKGTPGTPIFTNRIHFAVDVTKWDDTTTPSDI